MESLFKKVKNFIRKTSMSVSYIKGEGRVEKFSSPRLKWLKRKKEEEKFMTMTTRKLKPVGSVMILGKTKIRVTGFEREYRQFGERKKFIHTVELYK